MDEPGAAYEIRYGWNSPAWLALAFALLIGAGFVPGAAPPGNDHVELLLAPYVALVLPAAALRRTAVRIDPQGITLRGLLFFRGPEFLPWSEIVSVSLSNGVRGPGRFRLPELEVRHRKGPTPRGEPAAPPELRAFDAYLSTHVDPDFVLSFRGTQESTRSMALCKVDTERLKQAVQAFAPQVHVFGDVDRL
ncbi:PH domain-containing protein [Streptomyces sp. NPDC048527]|uniref:PH domain-containing protein n=1 Tax=Streptomyces sp. NPDC048527 TaxID=3365568 RepID=UPI0037179EA0